MPGTKAKDDVADSWEEIASDEEVEPQGGTLDAKEKAASPPSKPVASNAPPSAPMPASTLYQDSGPGMSFTSRGEATPERRPEKTDAVARRMIAAGLGLKAPKQTEEQKEYQKSVREQERKRREAARQEEARKKEEAERAKAAIWDD